MCILLKVKKHEKTFALNVDIFMFEFFLKKLLTNDRRFDKISKLSKTTIHQLGRVEKEK